MQADSILKQRECNLGNQPNAKSDGIIFLRKISKSSNHLISTLLSFFFGNLSGGWSKQEDLQILQFVLNNGTKWAKLSREMKNRTEHCVKNRFFGILAKYCLIPIKKIKKTLDYLNHGFLFEAIKYYQTLYGTDDHDEQVEEIDWNNFFKNFDDIFNE